MGLVADFVKIVELCAELEGTKVPPQVARRIANAYSRATEKALLMSWYESGNNEATNYTLFRHAERGARDFIQ